MVLAWFALAGRPVAWMSILGVLLVGAGSAVILAPRLVRIGTLAEHVRPAAYGAAYAVHLFGRRRGRRCRSPGCNSRQATKMQNG